ncbi:esterase/lipase family protein [Candidatus Zixiibacteriota bacterium]
MKLLFIHGWSVTHTDTYGELPEALLDLAPPALNLEIHHVYLGRYISFHDEVTMEDIARGFDKARKDEIGDKKFSCITHSTGGPVIRTWVDLYYGAKGRLNAMPLTHLIMLAPANHGSALAQLGKSRLGRIKAWWKGVEPGAKILNWLELGSKPQWDLNVSWLSYDPVKHNFYPFVFTGQDIDEKLYDHLNSYTGEKGSDGVIRVCAANMNYRYLKLRQNIGKEIKKKPLTHSLEIVKPSHKESPATPLAVIPEASHSGNKMGIMKSVKKKKAGDKPVVGFILKALQVKNKIDYDKFAQNVATSSNKAQSRSDKYSMIVFYLHDDRGNDIYDYDILLLGGEKHDPDKLPPGFFMDRQRNSINRNRLTYYLNSTIMSTIESQQLGLRVIARPQTGFSYYTVGEFHPGKTTVNELVAENMTLLVEIELRRHVDQNIFRLGPLEKKRRNFSKTKPANIRVP